MEKSLGCRKSLSLRASPQTGVAICSQNRTIFTLFCEFATKRLRIPTSLRAAKQVPLGCSSE